MTLIHRARDLFRGALIRTRFLGPLRQGITEIGKDVLILGSSEIGVSAALNLDLQGFRVRLVHRCDLPGEPGSPAASPVAMDPAVGAASAGRDILHVKQATIEEISGHIGDFQIKARVDGKRVHWRTDILC